MPSKLRTVPLDIAQARKEWGASHAFFVDMSKWQDVSDYAALANSIDAAIIKISGILDSGTIYEDSKAAPHIAGLTQYKKSCGGYHYCKFVGEDSRKLFEAREQAEFFIDCAKKYPLTILAPDMEPGELKAALRAGMEPADIEDWTREFVDLIKSKTSNPPAMYASTACLKAADGGLDWLRDSGLLLWFAGYPRPPFAWPPEGPASPLAWPRDYPLDGGAWAWQYAGGDDDRTPLIDEGGKAPGVKGDVDCNVTPRAGLFAKALQTGAAPSKLPTAARFIVGAGVIYLGGRVVARFLGGSKK